MASPKKLAGYWDTEDGPRVWVYKQGRSYWINHDDGTHLCHPSIRRLDDTRREATLVFHVRPTEFHPQV